MNNNVYYDVCILFVLVYHCKYGKKLSRFHRREFKCRALVMYSAASEISHHYFLCSVLLKVRYKK